MTNTAMAYLERTATELGLFPDEGFTGHLACYAENGNALALMLDPGSDELVQGEVQVYVAEAPDGDLALRWSEEVFLDGLDEASAFRARLAALIVALPRAREVPLPI